MDINYFNKFIRDLSLNTNINLKHIIEDINKKETKKVNKKKSKKDIIIEENNKRIYDKKIKEDEKKINYMLSNYNENKYNNVKYLKTEEGKKKYLLELLNYIWKNDKKNIKDLIYLYLYIKDENKDDDIIKKIGKKLEDVNYKEYLMKECGDMIPPLNYWGYNKKLEDWQINTINYIRERGSILISAPTSSGKSFISMAAGILYNKVLYICPAKAIAYQVGAQYVHMGYKVNFLVDGVENIKEGSNIYIGTPLEIENNYYKLMNIDFDYMVIDEIHNLNNEEIGDIYENLIKLFDCDLIGISASVNNIEYLKEKYDEIYPDKNIKILKYNKRFINHKNHLYINDKLIDIHPFNSGRPYTPRDIYNLWDYIDENVDCDILGPDEYIEGERLIDLEDCKRYEEYLINEVNKLEEKEEIYKHFEINNKINNENNLIKFLKTIKSNKMLPMILFNNDVCDDIYIDLYKNLEEEEVRENPYHYIILEEKNKCYNEYLDKLTNFKLKLKGSPLEIDNKLDMFKKKERNNYILKISNIYEKYIRKDKKLKKEYEIFLKNPDFNNQDVHRKHEEYCFNVGEPMDQTTIKKIKKELEECIGNKLNCSCALIQMLKRGIGLYNKNMPESYLLIIQRLLSNKEIGVVISDKSLCMGVDLPIRTSCLIEYKGNNNFSQEDYIQMGGRAGRRGLDTQGNIIFYGDINYKKLMSMCNPDIIGSSTNINENYTVIKSVNIDRCLNTNYFLNKDRKYEKISYFNNKVDKRFQWLLRKKKESNNWIINLNKLERYHENDLVNEICRLLEKEPIEDYKLKKYNKNYINIYYYTKRILLYINRNIYKKLYNNLVNINSNIESMMYVKYLKTKTI